MVKLRPINLNNQLNNRIDLKVEILIVIREIDSKVQVGVGSRKVIISEIMKLDHKRRSVKIILDIVQLQNLQKDRDLVKSSVKVQN